MNIANNFIVRNKIHNSRENIQMCKKKNNRYEIYMTRRQTLKNKRKTEWIIYDKRKHSLYISPLPFVLLRIQKL